MRSQDDADLRPSYVWLERHANGEKVQHECFGVDIDDLEQQDFLRFLDVQSLSNKDASYIRKEGRISYPRMNQIVVSSKHPIFLMNVQYIIVSSWPWVDGISTLVGR